MYAASDWAAAVCCVQEHGLTVTCCGLPVAWATLQQILLTPKGCKCKELLCLCKLICSGTRAARSMQGTPESPLCLCLQAGCVGVQRLVRGCPASDIEAYDEQLLTGLLGVLSHQHSRVRMTALTALNALVLKVTPLQLAAQDFMPAMLHRPANEAAFPPSAEPFSIHCTVHFGSDNPGHDDIVTFHLDQSRLCCRIHMSPSSLDSSLPEHQLKYEKHFSDPTRNRWQQPTCCTLDACSRLLCFEVPCWRGGSFLRLALKALHRACSAW